MFSSPPSGDILRGLLGHAEEVPSSVSWNLLHDERISPQRFSDFVNWSTSETTWPVSDEAELRTGLEVYHKERIRGTHDPAFLDLLTNETSIYPLGHSYRPHGNTKLVQVLMLSPMVNVFKRAKDRATVPGIANFFSTYGDPLTTTKGPGSVSDAFSVMGWLDQQLASLTGAPCSRTVVQSHPFLRALIEFMNDDRLDHPFNPVWATVWSDFKESTWSNPETWLDRLGIVRWDESKPEWIVIMGYRAGEVSKLVRPTQLDSGWYAAHFPTPAQESAGRTMDLDMSTPQPSPLPEYIHKQIPCAPEHLLACARINGSAVSNRSLSPPQRRHFAWLDQLPTPLSAWVKHGTHPALNRPIT